MNIGLFYTFIQNTLVQWVGQYQNNLLLVCLIGMIVHFPKEHTHYTSSPLHLNALSNFF